MPAKVYHDVSFVVPDSAYISRLNTHIWLDIWFFFLATALGDLIASNQKMDCSRDTGSLSKTSLIAV